MSKKAKVDSQSQLQTKEEETTSRASLDLGNDRKMNSRFPAEAVSDVWLNVFEKLGQNDKISFSQACPEWHNWTASKIPMFLFHEVAPILVNKLPEKDSLRCRELCQSWTEKLDHEFQTRQYNLRLPFEIGSFEKDTYRKIRNIFSSTEQIQKFMDDMITHPGNPFPGRHVYLRFNMPEMVQPELRRGFRSSVNNLLETFGEHVYYATITLDKFDQPGLRNEATLRDCLLRLPQLKRLGIRGETNSRRNPDEIRSFYEQNPFPRLENLETLEMHKMHFRMMRIVLNSCTVPASIKRLGVKDYEDKMCSFSEGIYNLVNLEVLETSLLIRDLEGYSNLQYKPPLKELKLKLTWSSEFGNLFKALEILADSLTHLIVVSMVTVGNPKDRADHKINLPKLERLEFSEYEGSLDPLAQFRSLKHLGIRSSRMEGEMPPRRSRMEGMEEEVWKRNQVQFYGFEDIIYYSNIWVAMPTLTTLKISSNSYNRQKYEHTLRVRNMTASYSYE